ncbi:TPA: hypothetical protein HIT98_003882 [Escherichia coli]|uniref:hypothetical protein n=1 Tax=Escherichia TaxID=561 RepID=UPI0012FFFE29|nr:MULTISPECIES: hypothetical protein [unclassified Escherichia]EES2027037.1 hypothetical protein [Escherichia coli]EFB2841189.1 hypothetical protein [Escherichia coli]EIY6704412.1 hypothetical protein [Escherichia coli]MBB2341325.1 hypothetical protein [Escherichia sp. 93.0750]MCF7291620.1 hypothetical protein [Escherichia coli]
MSHNKNALVSDNGASIYPSELMNFICHQKIPERIYLKTAIEFDARYIINAVNKWTFDYSGSRRYLCFMRSFTAFITEHTFKTTCEIVFFCPHIFPDPKNPGDGV